MQCDCNCSVYMNICQHNVKIYDERYTVACGLFNFIIYNSANIHCRKVHMCFLQIEERMSNAQELSEGWREIKEQKQDLNNLFQDMEQQLLSFSRRPAELETKIAQNMLSQAKVGNSIIIIDPFTRHTKGNSFLIILIKLIFLLHVY